MTEEQRMILEMVADKKISAEEGCRLLQQLEKTNSADGLVELDAINLLSLGVESLAQQIQMFTNDPTLSAKLGRFKQRLAQMTQEPASATGTETPERAHTERMKTALARLIERAEELNASLDRALTKGK